MKMRRKAGTKFLKIFNVLLRLRKIIKRKEAHIGKRKERKREIK